MKKKINRRDFLKYSGGTVGLFAATGLFRGPLEPLVDSHIKTVELRWGTETVTTCPFCSCGCGLICYTDGDKLVRVEGDPEHPINHGSVCPKGGALVQLRNGNEEGSSNQFRLQQVHYRAPGSEEWEIKDWDFALDRIARKIKDTRDQNWVSTNSSGRRVNRTDAITSLGGAMLSNEECYLISKMMRSLGVAYIEHQGRDSQASGISGLKASFGRGAMSNHWTDLSNSDSIMIIGSNMAENHAACFLHVKSAQDKGAVVISVDPRFTRTSAKANVYCPLRSGTDIAFIGGLINYVITDMENNPDDYNPDYIRNYTNASYLVRDGYQGPADLDGLFSGYNTNTGNYLRDEWRFQRDSAGNIMVDESLSDSNCVFQILKKHFARYTLGNVTEICGTSIDVLTQVYRAFSQTGRREKAGAIVCSTGVTQHTNATQIVRSLAVLQLLLGNIGVAGGGVNTLTVESNAQGATDHGMLSELLPGYIDLPRDIDIDMKQYKDRLEGHNDSSAGLLTINERIPALTSLLRSWYSTHARPENGFAYDNLPRLDIERSYNGKELFRAMSQGEVKGLMVWGQNPAVGSSNAGFTREALAKLDWMVVSDLFETETAAFWKRPGTSSSGIKTEVFLLPAAASFEKEGSVTNAGRWMQWRYQALDPLGESRSDFDLINELMKRLKALYVTEGGPHESALTDLTWDYRGPQDAAREINGVSAAEGRMLRAEDALSSDGGTSCGNRLYRGSMTETVNMAARRNRDPGGFIINLYHRWGWSWPGNTRILYNRASVDGNGMPWNERHPVIEWNSFTRTWKGDVPDGAGSPDMSPFSALIGGKGSLFSPGLLDGPIPEHYEPWESPVPNALSSVDHNPVINPVEGAKGNPADYPLVATTFRVGEHLGSGQMTRNMPWLLEMSPEPYIEIGSELAATRNIESGDLVTISSARGRVVMKALVTKRMKPFEIQGKTIHQVALPTQWGYMGMATGDSANILTPSAGDVNSGVPEFKSFLCDISKGA